MKPATAHLALPFFDAVHRELGQRLADWIPEQHIDESDDRQACKEWVKLLGANQWLRYCVPAGRDGVLGGALKKLDSRALVILRETLAFHSPLADFAFAMQGLGSGAITLAGTPAQQAAYLPQVASGEKIAAFALSEPGAGSDAGAMSTSATALAAGWALNGCKTWISNGGIADFYVTFAKTDPALGVRGITAFIVDADAPGLDSSEHITVMAPHPLATLKFTAKLLVVTPPGVELSPHDSTSLIGWVLRSPDPVVNPNDALAPTLMLPFQPALMSHSAYGSRARRFRTPRRVRNSRFPNAARHETTADADG